MSCSRHAAAGTHNSASDPRIAAVLQASRPPTDRCLRDLLHHWESGELNMDIVAVVSNHPTLEPMAARHGIPFHHLPFTAETKRVQKNALRTLVNDLHAELVVLARYMQILSDKMTAKLHGRCINIHHSFLPSFKGGSPYAQAHGRGLS